MLTVNIRSDLVILSKWYGVSLHVQDAGDGVTLGEGGKRADQLSSMVQVATVGTIQPHVSGRMVVVISHWPAGNTDTCTLIASVLFGDVELRRGEVYFKLLNMFWQHNSVVKIHCLNQSLPSIWNIQMWCQWLPGRNLSLLSHGRGYSHSPKNSTLSCVGRRKNLQWEYIHHSCQDSAKKKDTCKYMCAYSTQSDR